MKGRIKRTISIFITIAILLLSIYVATGWFIHDEHVRALIPGASKIKFNTALNFTLSSIVLLLHHFCGKSKIPQAISFFLCLLICLSGLLTLSEYIFPVSLGIDELFVQDKIWSTYAPGRMSPVTAINFIQIGIGLLFLDKETTIPYQFIYLFEIAFVALLLLICFYFIADIPTFFPFTMHVGIGFTILPIAIFLAQPMLQKTLSFEYLMLTGFLAVILLTLIISIYSFYYNKELVHSSRLVEHTHNVMYEAEQTMSLAKDIESGASGYTISNDSIYLGHFEIAIKRIYSHVKAIKKLTSENRLQRFRIDSLLRMINKQINFSHRLIQSRNKKDFGVVYQMMATMQGKFYTDRIRKLITEIQQEEADLLLQRRKRNTQSISAFNYAFRSLLITLALLFVTIFFVTRYNLLKRKKAEEQNKEREEQIQTIFKGAPDAVIAMDGDGRIVKWNPKAEIIFGWKEDEVLGTLLGDVIVPPRYREAHTRGLLHFLHSGEGPVLNKTIEVQALNKHANEFDISLSISPTLVKGKHLFVGFIRDITEQKKIQEELKKSNELFFGLFEHNPAAIVISRLSDARILKVNEAFLSSYGFSSREEVLNKTAQELNIVEHPEQREELARLLKENKIVKDFEIKTSTKQGKIFWISTSILIIEIENTPCLYSISIDISNRKEVEEQLQIANKELEAFSYSVSHDLRAPLRAIHGYTKILSEEHINKLDDDAKEMMDSVLRNAKTMGQLIDDLLAFSKLGRKELQIKPVNMTDIANEVLRDLKNSLPSLKAKVTVHPLLPANADRNLIRQVVFNLLSNAIKYSAIKPNPNVEITSFYESQKIIYCVKDNGVGFNMNYSNKLFGVFQRLHSNTEFEGTGVGLALVKRIITRHGGTVWAEGEIGKGASFYFSLNKN